MGLTLAVLLATFAPRGFAIDAKDLPEEERTRLNLCAAAAEAAVLKEKLGAKAFFVDVGLPDGPQQGLPSEIDPA